MRTYDEPCPSPRPRTGLPPATPGPARIARRKPLFDGVCSRNCGIERAENATRIHIRRLPVRRALMLFLGTALVAAPLTALAADAPMAAPGAAPVAAKASPAFKAPKNAFGQPDLSGFWTNATLTPMTRSPAVGGRPAYTPQEVKKMEAAVVAEVEEGNAPTDPNAPAEAKRREDANIRPEFAAAGGDVGGYNRGWLDPGSTVMRVHGEPRTSFLTTPNGRALPKKAGAVAPVGAPRPAGPMGQFDGPESRPLGERCIVSFGRTGGPPMLPNGFYNNNYHFIQTPTEVVIEVEMVHDVRHIRLNAKDHLAPNVRPWFGDSI